MKSKLFLLPEILLLLLSILWFFETLVYNGSFNLMALFLIGILFVQFYFKSKILGYSMAVLAMVVALYGVLAVVAEFNEFPTLTNQALQLLLIGMILSATLFIMGLGIFYRYWRLKN